MPSEIPLLLSIHIRLRIDSVTKRKIKFPITQRTLNASEKPVKNKKSLFWPKNNIFFSYFKTKSIYLRNILGKKQ